MLQHRARRWLLYRRLRAMPWKGSASDCKGRQPTVRAKSNINLNASLPSRATNSRRTKSLIFIWECRRGSRFGTENLIWIFDLHCIIPFVGLGSQCRSPRRVMGNLQNLCGKGGDTGEIRRVLTLVAPDKSIWHCCQRLVLGSVARAQLAW